MRAVQSTVRHEHALPAHSAPGPIFFIWKIQSVNQLELGQRGRASTCVLSCLRRVPPVAQPRPRIGITRWEDVLAERFADYCDRVRNGGGEPIELNSDVEAVEFDGLVLTGGIDVCPERYGETPHPTVKRTDAARDAFEIALIESALARDLPVLAICRGHQLLNVAFGGRLLQHIEDGSHRADFHAPAAPSRWHAVRLEPDSRLRELFGVDEMEVNSRHHQAVLPETLAPGLVATAFSPDGLVEGIESARHRWVIGVQWHPERLEPEHPGFHERSRPLFEALVAEARAVRELVP
jgi:putative glutamine amidotransferase